MMKKLFYLISFTFLFFFLFIPPVSAETKDITCNYKGDDANTLERECNGLKAYSAYYNGSKYVESGFSQNVPGYYMNFDLAKKYEVNVGPATLYPAYFFSLGNYYNEGYYYQYNFDMGKKYRITYTMYAQEDISILKDTKELLNSDLVNFKVMDKNEKLYVTGDDVFDLFGVGLEEETPSNPPYPNNPILSKIIRFYIEFEPLINIRQLQFRVGVADNSESALVRLITNESTTSSYITYENISVQEVDEFKSDVVRGPELDKPSKEDKDIFDSLKQCDALDIGCHVSNILTMLKNFFVRVGNFLRAVWDFIFNFGDFLWDLFVKFGNFILEGFKALFIPRDDFLKLHFDATLKVIDNKLGFISFPFEFLGIILNRFINMSDSVVNIINIPNIDIPPFGTLFRGTTWNITEYWQKAPFKQLYDVYLLFVHFFVAFGLYKLCERKFDEIVGGASS